MRRIQREGEIRERDEQTIRHTDIHTHTYRQGTEKGKERTDGHTHTLTY